MLAISITKFVELDLNTLLLEVKFIVGQKQCVCDVQKRR